MPLLKRAKLWFSRHRWKVPDLDGREVEIIFAKGTPDEERKRLERIIYLVCKEEKIAKNFVKLTFRIKENEFVKSYAWIDSGDARSGTYEITINYVRTQKVTKENHLYKMIVHELIHLWHYKVNAALEKNNQYILKMTAFSKQLVKEIKRETRRNKTSYDHLAVIRVTLGKLFHSLAIEGLAYYFGEVAIGKVPFSEKYFNINYANTVARAKKIEVTWKEYLKDVKEGKLTELSLEVTTLKVLLQEISPLCFHMTYAILFILFKKQRDMEAIAEMQTFRFVKEYEKAMKKRGLQPIISATSGEGILDYKTMLAEITATYNECVEKRAN